MPVEMWGGIECSRVHVRHGTVDQLELTGHDTRTEDMVLLAGLGLSAVRYPVLLGRTAPGGLDRPDWSFPDERLGFLRSASIRPVVTLMHHGTRYLGLDVLSRGFPEALARHAGAVAHRYPWITDYTPVNEPMTTARFSCLYGHWYPHRAGQPEFFRALLNLCRATVLAMQAVREVNPEARLVHTEDLGWTHSTPALSAQAGYENERRWLGVDLLCGRVDRGHPFHRAMLRRGITEEELAWFRDNPTPPDIFGCDYYPTSERVLDERLELYPAWSHGGNGRVAYADVHPALTEGFAPRGVEQLLLHVWDRYRLPLALTEVHLNADAETQVRWLNEAWQTARRLTDSGVTVRAVCSWALFGSYDWDSLMTRQDAYYEPGAFDLSTGQPTPTILASAIRQLAAEPQQFPQGTAEGAELTSRGLRTGPHQRAYRG